jgi:hypothetical protein
MQEVTRYVPKLLAVLGLGPFAFGVWWLTWVVTGEAITRSETWKPCTVTLVVAQDEKRFVECELEGKHVRVPAPPGKPFRSMSEGDKQPVMMNPANPEDMMNGSGVEMWASTGMLCIFGLFLTGSMVFLWRVDMSRPHRAAMVDEEEEDVEDVIAAPPPVGRVIILRQPKNVWKANLIWAGILGVFAIASLWGLANAEWMAAPFLLAEGWMIHWLVGQARYNRSFELRSEGKQVWIQSCRGEETLSASEIAAVREVDRETFRFEDAQGKMRLQLSMGMGEEREVREVIKRLRP